MENKIKIKVTFVYISGPFIVNYDLHNWDLLSQFLEKHGTNGQIPAATRAKLIHDSLNLAYAGKLRFDAALNVTKFLYNEKDPIVWQAAFNMFDHIQRHLEGSETGKKFQVRPFIYLLLFFFLECADLKLFPFVGIRQAYFIQRLLLPGENWHQSNKEPRKDVQISQICFVQCWL